MIKDFCVICHNQINPDFREDYYLKNGNFCITCSGKCGMLSKIYMFPPSFMRDEEMVKASLDLYRREAEKFQKEILEIRSLHNRKENGKMIK